MSSKILIFAGSLRKNSYNFQLAQIAAGLFEQMDATPTLLKISDYPLPIYNSDDEEKDGLPENALQLKQLFKQHQGLFICSPEYNSSYSAALKNLIDWVSRPAAGEQSLECFRGKIAAIASASPGALGGLRGLQPLRMLLENIQVMVIPDQLAIASAHEAFTVDAQLKDSKKQEALQTICKKLVTVTSALQSNT